MDWKKFTSKINLLLKPYKEEIDLKISTDTISYDVYGEKFMFFKNEEAKLNAKENNSLPDRHLYETDIFDELQERINNSTLKGLSLETKNSYEVVLLGLNRSINNMNNITYKNVLDKNNGITYEIKKASFEMIYNILSQLDGDDYAWMPWMNFKEFPEKFTLTLDNLLRNLLNWPYTITIKHIKPMDTDKLNKYIDSFIFDAAYNCEAYMRTTDNLEDLLGPKLTGKVKKLRLNELDAPKRKYNKHLVNYYIQYGSTKDPMNQFIALYHVMEYFFDIDYDKKLLDSLKATFDRSCDSTIKEENIKELLKFLKEQYNIKRSFSEKDKLKLTLTNHMTINNVCKSIELNHKDLIKYYKSNEVPFSKGSRVHLKGDIEKDIINDLADRIYKTRLSLVHSKADDKGELEEVYIPFKDEEALKKEIPLMKAIAEEIIIKTAEEI